jgi:hypothetical protein
LVDAPEKAIGETVAQINPNSLFFNKEHLRSADNRLLRNSERMTYITIPAEPTTDTLEQHPQEYQ